MNEDNLAMFLAVSLVVLLLAGSFFQSIVASYAAELLPKVSAQIVCQKQGGQYVLSQPTSLEACNGIARMKSFLEVDCNSVSQQKRSSCSNLQSHLSVRLVDCVNSLLPDAPASPYSFGSPQIVGWCDEFSA